MFFNKELEIRIREKEYKEMNRVIKKNKDLYESRSHFIRCAILNLLMKHRER